MNKLTLSLLMIASTSALLGMHGTTGHTLKEVIANDSLRLQDCIHNVTTKSGKTDIALDLRGRGLTSIEGIATFLKDIPGLDKVENRSFS